MPVFRFDDTLVFSGDFRARASRPAEKIGVVSMYNNSEGEDVMASPYDGGVEVRVRGQRCRCSVPEWRLSKREDAPENTQATAIRLMLVTIVRLLHVGVRVDTGRSRCKQRNSEGERTARDLMKARDRA